MIFVTVGTQLPFDRLVRTVDNWAGSRQRTDVFAQIGPTPWSPHHITWTQHLDALTFQRKVEQADFLVAHAGMGTIITALELGKPILVMPRREHLREQRNDHQYATAVRLRELGKIVVAMDEAELITRLEALDDLRHSQKIGKFASTELLETLRRFINQT